MLSGWQSRQLLLQSTFDHAAGARPADWKAERFLAPLQGLRQLIDFSSTVLLLASSLLSAAERRFVSRKTNQWNLLYECCSTKRRALTDAYMLGS